jgi:hypothetical protein
MFLVIDALDKYDAGTARDSILEVLKNIKTLSVRFSMTSRPYPDNIKSLF